jgi:lysophospholipase L1-like esterase
MSPVRSHGLRSKIVLAVISTAMSLTAVAAFGEFAARYRERHRVTVPTNTPLLFYQHRRLRHALVRNYNYYGWININSYGFRGPEIRRQKDLETFRVIVAGGSTTYDNSVSGDDRTWPARLQLWLDQLAPNLHVEVINAGVPGYTVLDNLIRLQTELYAFNPDVLILYSAHNDLRAALSSASTTTVSTNSTPDELPVVTPWRHWLSRNSMLFTKLVSRWRFIQSRARQPGRSRPQLPRADSWPEVLALGQARFERDLRSFVLVARGMGLRVVLPHVVHISTGGAEAGGSDILSIWQNAVPYAPTEELLQGYDLYNSSIQKVASCLGVDYVPAGAFGKNHSVGWYAEGDPIHFSDMGADAMGEHIAKALLVSGILAERPGLVDRVQGLGQCGPT